MMGVNIKFIICLAVVFSMFLFSFIFLFSNTVLAEPPLNEPPETYAGQVIIKYTQNYKEIPEDGMSADEKVLIADVMGTLYPLYTKDYRNDEIFSGKYFFKEGQISWSYNAKGYTSSYNCQYLTTSVGSGNIDIGHTDKIYLDSEIWEEDDGEYTMDINNYGRIYLTAEGLPTEDFNLAQKPVQMTSILISGDKFCGDGGAPTNEVPPAIYIRLENLKANKNILSGSEAIHSTNDPWKTYTLTEMISYTIELPPVKNGDNALEEPAISNDNPDKPGLLEIFWNWIKNLFGG